MFNKFTCLQEVWTYAAQVANADLEGHAGTALVAARQVIRQPCDDTGERWVDGAGGDENAAVHDVRVAGGDTHGEPDDHDAEERQNEGASLAHSVGEVGCDNSQYRGSDVDGNGHELRRARGVPKIANDGGQE